MCDAIGQGPRMEEVRCIVDWPHTIHCGYAGRVRCRWTDDGRLPPEAERREWDEKWREIQARLIGTGCDCTGAPHRWEVGCPVFPSSVAEEVKP